MIARNESYLVAFLRQTYFPLTLPMAPTRADYEDVCRIFADWHASRQDYAPWQITPELLGGYFEHLVEARGCAGTTARKHRRVLRAVLRVARRKRLLAIELDEIPLPSATKRLPRAWSIAQLEAMLAAARALSGFVGPWPMGIWLPALMFTCLATDWRITAVMTLRTKNVSLDGRYAFSEETKQHKERSARLTEQCVEALSQIWDPAREEVFGDWPFDRTNRQWQTLNNLLGDVIQAAAVPDIGRWHAFRKTATTLVADRAGRSEASRFAGHSRQQITDEHYIDDTQLCGPKPSDCLPRLGEGPRLRVFS